MNTIHVDGAAYEVPPGRNLLEVCLSLGLDLPYFCWHPALGSVGACRQCAVTQYKDEEDEDRGGGRVVMACMTPATDGARIAIEHPDAREARAQVIEWLMVGHPHDCPVCDEGGECHLQDMTVMTGHDYRRYRFDKRTHENQYLGPFVHHEMNRCIACYRCVRFYRDHAGGRDLHELGSHHNVYFGRHEDGVLESEFAGNLVEVCPTGVFTDKTLRHHFTRKWDLSNAPSICVHCGLGCNTLVGERGGAVRRILDRYHDEVNGHFLCDRGRFGYEFTNSEQRVRSVLVRDGGELREARDGELDDLGRLGGGRIWGIGSPRATLEANFALKQLVGAGRFSTGLGDRDHALAQTAANVAREAAIPTPSLARVRGSDAVLILGEDPSDTAPILALALRQAARQGALAISREIGIPDWNDAAVREALQGRTGPFHVVTPSATRLDDLATTTLRARPSRIARVAAAIARALDPDAPDPGTLDEADNELAKRIAADLAGAKRPVVVSGTGAGTRGVMHAAACVATALAKVHESEPSGLVLTLSECNTMGTALLDGVPLDAVLAAVERGEADAVIVLENDLFRRAEPARVDAFFDRAPVVVAIDHTRHATVERADLVLPAATFAEADGTLVSSEGRAQRLFQACVPVGATLASWRWLVRIDAAAGGRAGVVWERLDDVVAAIAASDPVFARIPDAAPGADFRIAGQRVPRSPARCSGRTAINAGRSVHEPKPPEDRDSPLAFSMEGTRSQPPAALTPYYWKARWNSVQALNRFREEVTGPMRGGESGCRLLEPETSQPRYPDRLAEDSAGEGELTVVPLYHVFGSEELSALGPAIAERVPAPYLALHPGDAAKLDPAPADGDEVELELAGTTLRLPVRLREDLPAGVAGLPVGLPGLAWLRLPAAGNVDHAAEEVGR